MCSSVVTGILTWKAPVMYRHCGATSGVASARAVAARAAGFWITGGARVVEILRMTTLYSRPARIPRGRSMVKSPAYVSAVPGGIGT